MRSLLLGLAFGCAACLPAAELWVDASAIAGGDGSATRPFATISAAAKAAKSGDIITVRAGVYSEAVQLNTGGTAEQPSILRAAPGERVVLSGFTPLTGWQPAGDGVYTTTAAAPLSDLFVGLDPQPVSRWPGFDQPMRYARNPQRDGELFGFQDGAGLAGRAPLAEVASSIQSAMVYFFLAAPNVYSTVPLAAIDLDKNSISVTASPATNQLQGKADRFQIVNHRALIQKPGEWAFEKIDAKQVRVYFRPAILADLARTQYRGISNLLTVRADHVRVEGLELSGSAGYGLQVYGANDVKVSRVIAHHNQGIGLFVRRSGSVELRNNISLLNGSGVNIVSSTDVLMEGNEVAMNMVDGIDIAGNVTGRPGGEPFTRDVTLRRNYFHHHMLLSHPDNIQTYRGVSNLTFDENLALWGGQAVMTEETDNASIRNCVLFGTGANVVIFGHSNSTNWTVRNSTIGFGGWGSFLFSAQGFALQNNVIYNNPLMLADGLTSDYNLFWNTDPNQPAAITAKPRWQSFNDLAKAAEATGQETHSQRADPLFRSAPFAQAVSPWDDANRPDLLVLRFGARDAALFQKDDRIEISGDGVLRRVTAVLDKAIQFDPPLPVRPFRDVLVWNWKDAVSTVLDLRVREGSPASNAGKDGKPAGAAIDIPAFQRGDFDGDGRRDLPELPADVKASIPNPNAIVVPLYGA